MIFLKKPFLLVPMMFSAILVSLSLPKPREKPIEAYSREEVVKRHCSDGTVNMLAKDLKKKQKYSGIAFQAEEPRVAL